MASFEGFDTATVKFLRALDENNDKKWFEAHRADYEAHYVEPAKALVAALGPRLQKVAPGIKAEPRINGSIFRINRDVRFSKDKTPYKPHVDLWFWDGPEKGWDCSGFFFRLGTKTLVLGAGMHQLGKSFLPAYRKAIADDTTGAVLEKIVAKIERAGYEIGGTHYKKVPKGFDPDHSRKRLLLHAGLYAHIEMKHPKELGSKAFVGLCERHYKKLVPLHDWLAPLAARSRR